MTMTTFRPFNSYIQNQYDEKHLKIFVPRGFDSSILDYWKSNHYVKSQEERLELV